MLIMGAIIVLILAFIFFGNKIPIINKFHNDVIGNKLSFDKQKDEIPILIVPPENDWCKISNIAVDEDVEKPREDRIIGWDEDNKCCARKITGYNCALNKDINVQYCYTSHISGVIKWVLVDGYYLDVNLYKSYTDDLDKQQIPNKVCNIEKYPEWMR